MLLVKLSELFYAVVEDKPVKFLLEITEEEQLTCSKCKSRRYKNEISSDLVCHNCGDSVYCLESLSCNSRNKNSENNYRREFSTAQVVTKYKRHSAYDKDLNVFKASIRLTGLQRDAIPQDIIDLMIKSHAAYENRVPLDIKFVRQVLGQTDTKNHSYYKHAQKILVCVGKELQSQGKDIKIGGINIEYTKEEKRVYPTPQYSFF